MAIGKYLQSGLSSRPYDKANNLKNKIKNKKINGQSSLGVQAVNLFRKTSRSIKGCQDSSGSKCCRCYGVGPIICITRIAVNGDSTFKKSASHRENLLDSTIYRKISSTHIQSPPSTFLQPYPPHILFIFSVMNI